MPRRSVLLAAALLAVLLSLPAARASAAPGDPGVVVVKSADAKRPHAFQLKGGGGEVLCTSEGFKSEGQALKAAKAAQAPGRSLKNYVFQKTASAAGEKHWWELRDAKKKKVLCTSEKVEDFSKAEHTAGLATKAFAKVAVQRWR